MNKNDTPSNALGFLMRTTFTLITACLLAAVLVSQASATHFRYGQITWTQVSGTTVEATVQLAWRRAGFITCVDPTHADVLTDPFGTAFVACTGAGGLVGLGDVAAPFTAPLDWGDVSTPTTLYLLVTSVDLVNDWFFGVALDPGSLPSVGAPTDTTLPHTYTVAGDYTAVFESCCRLSPPTLSNNADGGFSVETVINAGVSNNSPVTALPPIVLCPVDSLCTFSVPAADIDEDTLSYRLSLSDEAKGVWAMVGTSVDEFVQPGFDAADIPGPALPAPGPASIDINTGLYTWDTTGAGSAGDLYSTQVTIEDGTPPGSAGTSKIAVDFLIQLAAADPNPPIIGVFGDPDPTCAAGNEQFITVGSNLTFSVVASDIDITDTLTVNAVGLPASASMTPPLPLTGTAGMSVTSMFSWTPVPADAGPTVVTFNVSNGLAGGFALCAVTINVDGTIADTLPGSDVPVFDSFPGSGIPLSAIGELAVTGGQSDVLCCTVQDANIVLKKGKLIKKWNPFDIGLAANVEPSCLAKNLPLLTAGDLIISRHFGVHTDPSIDDGDLDVTDHRYGLCVVQTDVIWLGPVVVDIAASEVDGIDYDVVCKLHPVGGIDNQPLTLARTTSLPEHAPKMRAITTECDPRGTGRWSDWWFVVNAEHLTAKESSKTYVGRMSAHLKGLIEAMRADGAVDSAFLDGIKGLVLDAEKLFKSKKSTPADAAVAMLVLDTATIDALTPPPGTASPYPGSTFPSTLFTNPKGELVSHLMALRYAVCSERAHADDLGMCEIDSDVELLLPGGAP